MTEETQERDIGDYISAVIGWIIGVAIGVGLIFLFVAWCATYNTNDWSGPVKVEVTVNDGQKTSQDCYYHHHVDRRFWFKSRDLSGTYCRK